MSERRFVGTFDTKESLLAKINELKENGYDEGELFVVTERDEAIHVLKRETDLNVEGDTSWLDNLNGVGSEDWDTKQALTDLGIADDEIEQAHSTIKKGDTRSSSTNPIPDSMMDEVRYSRDMKRMRPLVRIRKMDRKID